MLDFIGKGDVLLVTRVDRLARSIGDLQDIVRTLKAKGASLRATEQPIARRFIGCWLLKRENSHGQNVQRWRACLLLVLEWNGWMALAASVVCPAGLYWLWDEHINAGPMPSN